MFATLPAKATIPPLVRSIFNAILEALRGGKKNEGGKSGLQL